MRVRESKGEGMGVGQRWCSPSPPVGVGLRVVHEFVVPLPG